MTTTDDIPILEPPETLRSILDRGGDVGEVYARWGYDPQKAEGAWSSIIDYLLYDGPGEDPQKRYNTARWHGDLIRKILDEGCVGRCGPDGLGGLRILLSAVWHSEIASDDQLAHDLMRAMPSGARAEYEWRRRMLAIPHRLMAATFDTSDQYYCSSCNDRFVEGDRYVMAEGLGHALFCIACVEDVLTAAKAVAPTT